MRLSKFLFDVTESQKIEIVKRHGKTWDEFEEILADFKRWIEHSRFAKYNIARTENLAYFLMNSKLNVEKAKKNIENYCQARASFPGFYKKLIPGTEYFETAWKLGKLIRIPKLTPGLEEMTIYKIDDIPGNAPDALYYYVSTVMMIELGINEDYFLSRVVVIDLSGFSLKCLVKYTPQINFMIMKAVHAFNMRVSQIHIVNAPPFMSKILNLAKYIVAKKLFERIKIHDTVAGLYEYVPKDCLPSDYGGTLRSYEEIYDDWLKEINLHKDVFEKAAAEEYPSEDKFLLSEIAEGAPSGTFKSLIVD